MQVTNKYYSHAYKKQLSSNYSILFLPYTFWHNRLIISLHPCLHRLPLRDVFCSDFESRPGDRVRDLAKGLELLPGDGLLDRVLCPDGEGLRDRKDRLHSRTSCD